MKSIKLYWWQPKQYKKFNLRGFLSGEMKRYKNVPSNFGDELSAYIVSKALERQVIKADKNESGKLLSIGSILHHAKNNDVIWGSGINGKYINRKIKAHPLTILSVRGPLTRDILLKNSFKVPEIYGDPGILVSKYYTPKDAQKKEYVFVPHFSEIEQAKKIVPIENIVLPTNDLFSVIDNIFNAELVISSSLHGIIVAESYGIPAILFKFTDNEPMFKYEDYYKGTNRLNYKFATTLEQAFNIKEIVKPIYNSELLIQILKEYYA